LDGRAGRGSAPCPRPADLSRGLKLSDFRTRALQRVYFKSFPRAAAIKPERPVILEKGEDELHPGRKRLTLSFLLPRGSYATILIKRLSLGESGGNGQTNP
jgi:tRNA pseudouridine13 synthase